MDKNILGVEENIYVENDTICNMFLFDYGVNSIHFVKVRKVSKNWNKIWTGTSAIVVICLLGIYSNNICYLAAVLGFAVADEIGKTVGWHK